MELSPKDARVLGALVEKQRTTPDQYPLTTNALRTACNQKSSRHPVVAYSDIDVDQTMKSLRERGLARSTQSVGSRTVKHRQIFDEALGLDDQMVSIMALLFLRGPQTLNELLTRSSRLCSFADEADVRRTLEHLSSRDEPLVKDLGRAPGQRESRWTQLLCLDEGSPVASTAMPAPNGHSAAPSGHDVPRSESSVAARLDVDGLDRATAPEGQATASRVAELEEEVISLRSDLDALREEFDRLLTQLGA